MKNIVMCCDGTGNEYGKNNTNVVEIYSLALKNKKQITFYDPGIALSTSLAYGIPAYERWKEIP